MNSFTKRCIKFSLITFAIGIVICIAAFSFGGRVINLAPKNLINISQSYSGVESIDLNLEASEVEVKIGNEFKVEASNVSDNSFKSYVQGGIWYIKDELQSKIFSINNDHSKIVIYIPEFFNANEFRINLGAGQLIVDNFISSNTDIKVGAGNLVMNSLTTDKINIDCGVGNIDINGVVNNNGVIKCGIGKVNLDLKGNDKDYNYNLNVGIGEVSINNNCFGGLGNKFIDNSSQDKSFKIECGIGKVELNINQ